MEQLLNSDDPNAPLFPRAYKFVQKSGAVQTLSNTFYEMLVSSGLAQPRSRKSTGRGRSVRRKTNPLSFHSLRHTATSLMKNAGVNAAVVQDIISHSPEMSRHYRTIAESAKREALNLIPDIR